MGHANLIFLVNNNKTPGSITKQTKARHLAASVSHCFYGGTIAEELTHLCCVVSLPCK